MQHTSNARPKPLVASTHARAGSPSFRDLLARVKAVVRGALDNADLPFTRVVEAAGVPRSAAHSPLFQVMCVLQDASLDEEVVMDGLKQEAVEVRARVRQAAAFVSACAMLLQLQAHTAKIVRLLAR